MNEKVICSGCATNCTLHFFMCSKEAHPLYYCPLCFKEHPCGKGEHGNCEIEATTVIIPEESST